MKVTIKILLLIGLAVYLVFAFVKFNKRKHETVCSNVVINVLDSDKADFVSKEDIWEILQTTKLDPRGKNMSDVRLGKIKKAVDGHQFVLNSLCYTTPKGEVVIEVSQKLPVLRVMPNEGEEYYVDANGNKIPHVQYPADVVVVTGFVNYKKDRAVLSTFGQIVYRDEFWSDMIEQINFCEDGDVELTPRLGNHIVALGKPNELGRKLSRLKLLYEKVLNTVGWNKYCRISLEYANQAICTKFETNKNK